MDDVIHILIVIYVRFNIFLIRKKRTYVLNSGFRETVGNLDIFHL